MQAQFDNLLSQLNAQLGPHLLRAALLLVFGVVLARLLGRAASALVVRLFDRTYELLARRVVQYGVVAMSFAMALQELGFDLGVLLGAAGIITVALGFAAQTSASNLISGLFLMIDRAFALGNVISVDGVTGEVVAIDLLSVKLRTFDNLMVRVPNESLIKATFTNLTRYPIRRIDLPLTLPYDADLEALGRKLVAVVDADEESLEEPGSELRITGLTENGVNLQLVVWCRTDRFTEIRTRLFSKLKATLDAEGMRLAGSRHTLEIRDPTGTMQAIRRGTITS